jgi:hypothetical protein
MCSTHFALSKCEWHTHTPHMDQEPEIIIKKSKSKLGNYDVIIDTTTKWDDNHHNRRNHARSPLFFKLQNFGMQQSMETTQAVVQAVREAEQHKKPQDYCTAFVSVSSAYRQIYRSWPPKPAMNNTIPLFSQACTSCMLLCGIWQDTFLASFHQPSFLSGSSGRTDSSALDEHERRF